MIVYMDSGLKTLRLYTIDGHERSRFSDETSKLEWMTKGKTTLIQKDPQNEPSLPIIDR